MPDSHVVLRRRPRQIEHLVVNLEKFEQITSCIVMHPASSPITSLSGLTTLESLERTCRKRLRPAQLSLTPVGLTLGRSGADVMGESGRGVITEGASGKE